MNRRGYDYRIINPNVPCRVVMDLDKEAAAILSRLQDREQKRRDCKVAVKHLVADIITGRVKLD